MNVTEPAISVVVATQNRAERLAALLESLRGQTLDRDRFEVVVVDDASTDGETGALLEREREREQGGLRLRVLRRPVKGGPAAARNQGWRAARAPLVAFTDDDCTADPGWLEAGLGAAGAHEGAIVQGSTEPDPREFPVFGPFSHTLRIDRLGPWFETANMFYPRSVLETLGGFDEQTLTVCGEDTDLAWRAIRAEHPAIFAADARVFHCVERRGAVKMLRLASRWHQAVYVFGRYPEIRERFHRRIFWKWTHYALVRFLVALLLPRRFLILKQWLARPYVRYLLVDQSRRAKPIHAPYIFALDLAELVAMVRGSIRYRTLVL